VVLNKADLDEKNAAHIHDVCTRSNIPVLGNIPFDETFTAAMLHAQPITQYAPDCPSSKEVQNIWHNLKQILQSR
jgi:MinD superfamily P-loop ATPase